MNHDWVTAEAVQKNLLPRHQLTFGDLECETYYRPFHIIGGDYYDFVPFDRGTVGIAIGDVSGKGIGAALMMANLQASLRARLLNQDTRPPAVIESVSHLLYESSLPHIYATLFYGEYDVEERVLTYVNAGHNPPLILRQEGDRARLIRLESEGPPIGMFRDTIYEGRSCLLQPGDVFIAYTDGITESSNPMQQFWGLERLEATLSKCIGKGPADIIEAVLTARDEFAGPIAPADDMTLVVASIDGDLVKGSLKVRNRGEGARCNDIRAL